MSRQGGCWALLFVLLWTAWQPHYFEVTQSNSARPWRRRSGAGVAKRGPAITLRVPCAPSLAVSEEPGLDRMGSVLSYWWGHALQYITYILIDGSLLGLLCVKHLDRICCIMALHRNMASVRQLIAVSHIYFFYLTLPVGFSQSMY